MLLAILISCLALLIQDRRSSINIYGRYYRVDSPVLGLLLGHLGHMLSIDGLGLIGRDDTEGLRFDVTKELGADSTEEVFGESRKAIIFNVLESIYGEIASQVRSELSTDARLYRWNRVSYDDLGNETSGERSIPQNLPHKPLIGGETLGNIRGMRLVPISMLVEESAHKCRLQRELSRVAFGELFDGLACHVLGKLELLQARATQSLCIELGETFRSEIIVSTLINMLVKLLDLDVLAAFKIR